MSVKSFTVEQKEETAGIEDWVGIVEKNGGWGNSRVKNDRVSHGLLWAQVWTVRKPHERIEDDSSVGAVFRSRYMEFVYKERTLPVQEGYRRLREPSRLGRLKKRRVYFMVGH